MLTGVICRIPTVEELVKLLADPTEIEPPPGNRPGKPKAWPISYKAREPYWH